MNSSSKVRMWIFTCVVSGKLVPEEKREKESQFHIAAQFPKSEAFCAITAFRTKPFCTSTINLLHKSVSVHKVLLHKTHCIRIIKHSVNSKTTTKRSCDTYLNVWELPQE